MTFDLTYADHGEIDQNGDDQKDEGMMTRAVGVNGSGDDHHNQTGGPVQAPTPLIATCFGSGLKNINMSVR